MVKLANEENLKKGAPFRFRTGEQQVETARRGGIASGEARRRKKTMKETARMLLDMEIPDAAKELKAKLKAMGISEEDFTYQSAVMVGMLNQAMKGNPKAATFLRDTAGENPLLMEEEGSSLADAIEDAYRSRIGDMEDAE